MTTYRTTKCPYCKTTLQAMQKTYWNDYSNNLGEPIAYCYNCKKPYKTGKEKWSKMNRFQKFQIYWKLIVSFIFYPLYIEIFLIIVWFVLTTLIPKFSEYEESVGTLRTMVIVYCVLFPITTTLASIRFKQEIKENYE